MQFSCLKDKDCSSSIISVVHEVAPTLGARGFCLLQKQQEKKPSGTQDKVGPVRRELTCTSLTSVVQKKIMLSTGSGQNERNCRRVLARTIKVLLLRLYQRHEVNASLFSASFVTRSVSTVFLSKTVTYNMIILKSYFSVVCKLCNIFLFEVFEPRSILTTNAVFFFAMRFNFVITFQIYTKPVILTYRLQCACCLSR